VPLVVRGSSERARHAVRLDCSFANKQESPPALPVVVHRGRLGIPGTDTPASVRTHVSSITGVSELLATRGSVVDDAKLALFADSSRMPRIRAVGRCERLRRSCLRRDTVEVILIHQLSRRWAEARVRSLELEIFVAAQIGIEINVLQ
jgi:hypothetical protein